MKREKRPEAVKTEVRGTLTESAYHALKQAIVCGELEEGTFISEAEARRRFGIGRTPLREACNRLHHERLLEAEPRRGYRVTELTFREVRDVFEVRLLLEAITAELAAERADRAQIAGLEAIVQRVHKLSGSPKADEELIRLNTEFHVEIARMSQNEELLRLITAVLEKSERLAHIEHKCRRYRYTDFETTHKPIVAALARRDGTAAREAVVADITEAQMAILGHESRGEEAGRRAVQAVRGAIRNRIQ